MPMLDADRTALPWFLPLPPPPPPPPTTLPHCIMCGLGRASKEQNKEAPTEHVQGEQVTQHCVLGQPCLHQPFISTLYIIYIIFLVM